MHFNEFNISRTKPKVLIAPLDWGLGHATRCIPIIYELLHNKCEVIIAASGNIKYLLQLEFPQIKFVSLEGYNIRYSQNKKNFSKALLLQIPQIVKAIYKEHKTLAKIIEQNHINLIISDNRLGFYNKNITSIYITHQLTIKTGNKFTEWLMQKIHYFFINKFDECWVPDNVGVNNLAGELSHPCKMPKTKVNYLGILSRFEKIEETTKFDILILISGPEPQRTLFENIILKQLEDFAGTTLLIRGVPNKTEENNFSIYKNSKIKIINHLNATALNKAIAQSKIIICRSGYTTLMDLVKLQKRAILIATPGQTEQEYLSKEMLRKELFYTVSQDKFNLQEALYNFEKMTTVNFEQTTPPYKTIIENIVNNTKV